MGRAGKIMIFFVIALGLLFCVIFFLFLNDLFRKPGVTVDNKEITAVVQITDPAEDPERLLPARLFIGRKAQDVVFHKTDGGEISLSELLDSSPAGVWISYNTTDLKEQPEVVSGIQRLMDDHDFTAVIVGSESCVSSGILCLTDPDSSCYETWDLKTMPTDVILDADGMVMAVHAGPLTSGETEGMLKSYLDGRDNVSLAFIEGVMSDGSGGFYTNTAVRGDSPSGKDVLSESQGLVMMAALERNDRELFDRTWNFTKNHLMKSGIAAWYVNSAGVPADVNALLDDLRLWHALYRAGQQWPDGAYAADAAEMLAAMKELCLDEKNRPVDFTDLESKIRSDTISLQYLDLAALKAMAEADPDFEEVYQTAENILLDGKISESFPLFYKNYNYTARSYDSGNLNSAEALYTLWNLSRAGLLPEDSLNWLRDRVMKGTLAARYRINGEVVSGYNFHSTAVYGLAALIALASDDADLFEMALRRMDRQLILDADDVYFGAYSQPKAVVYSFDQLIPLLVNVSLMR